MTCCGGPNLLQDVQVHGHRTELTKPLLMRVDSKPPALRRECGFQPSIARATSFLRAPSANSDRTRRSRETVGSAASSFATRDWLEPSLAASVCCEIPWCKRRSRTLRLNARRISTRAASSFVSSRNCSAVPTRQPARTRRFFFDVFMGVDRISTGVHRPRAGDGTHRLRLVASFALSSRTLRESPRHHAQRGREFATRHRRHAAAARGSPCRSKAWGANAACSIARPAAIVGGARPLRPVRQRRTAAS